MEREYRRVKWPEDIEERLGTVSDRKIAKDLGCKAMTVGNLRRSLNIPSWRSTRRVLPKGMAYYDPEASRIFLARRRHMKLGLPDTLTYEQWLFALQWFENKCAYCGAESVFLVREHLVPVAKGGGVTALNIVPACQPCNSSKGPKRAHLWIYEKFGMTKGKEIVDRIVAYLTEVKEVKVEEE